MPIPLPTRSERVLRRLRFLQRQVVKPPSITLDGVKLGVDYENWSELMVHEVLLERYELPERLLIQRLLEPEDRVLEIGGGLGLIALLAGRIVGDDNVAIYEANPRLIKTIEANFARNGRTAPVRNAAVVGRSINGSTATFHLHRDFWASSLVDKPGMVESIEVPTVALSELIERHKPSVLIMDVEGAEYDMLLPTDLSSIDRLCLEVHSRYIGIDKISEIVQTLLASGFKLDLPKSEGEILLFSR